jgi:hypothetical protein
MDDSALTFSRREFLAAGAAGAIALGSGFSLTTAIAASDVGSDRLKRAMRWIQLALVEKDPATFDPDWWLAFFKRVHAQGACISAGGMCAFYPTEIPGHHRSEWLGDKDTLGYLIDGCRKLDMAVIARVDPHCIRDADAQAHLDWVAVDANGRKARHMVMQDRWLSCALGPCNMEFMPKVVAEIAGKYDIDAFFANRWAGHITCYCDSCKANFKTASGFEAPTNRNERGWSEFQKWRTARLFEVWDAWDAAVQKVKPNVPCLMNMGGAHDPEMEIVGKRAKMVAADRQSRKAAVMPPWAAGYNAKVFRSVMGDRPVAGICSVGVDDNHRWKDSVTSAAELKLWILECIANGMHPWVVKFCGTLYDKRWIPPTEEVFAWHAANEGFLKNRQNLARVGLVWSPQTSAAVTNAKAEGSQFGVCHALVEARIPFEMVYEHKLEAESLKPFKLLVLPNIAALSDAQCDALRKFVAGGGSVVATFETSLYDENGKKRSDFALADLFGVSYGGKTESFVKNSYIDIDHDTKHAVLRGFDDAGRMINTIGYAEVKPNSKFDAPPLTRVPSYPDLPMEDVFPREAATDIPEVFLREAGTGRVVYFPGDICRTFWEVLDADHGRLIANTVRWALNEPDVLTIEGSGVIDANVWEQENSVTAHLVNLTNPMMMKGPMREILPLGPQNLMLRLPASRGKAKEVRLLVSGAKVEPEIADGTLRLTVPQILDHEVVAVSF